MNLGWKRLLSSRRNLATLCLFLVVVIVIMDVFSLALTGSPGSISSRVYGFRHNHKGTPGAETSNDSGVTNDNANSHGVADEPIQHDPSASHNETTSTTQEHSDVTYIAPDSHQSLDNDPFFQGLCTEYFHDLYDFDNGWGIENYGDANDDANKINTRRSVRHIRAYANCFLRNNVSTSRNLTDLESRLFPAFNYVMPEFTRWDGKKITGRFPTQEDYKSPRINKRSSEEYRDDNNVPSGGLDNVESGTHHNEHPDSHSTSEYTAHEHTTNDQHETANGKNEHHDISEPSEEYKDELSDEDRAAKAHEQEQREREEARAREEKQIEENRQREEREKEEERLNKERAIAQKLRDEYLASYSYWRDVRDQSNSRGIVFSLSDGGGVFELKRLLQVLRMQGNTYPIQVVHKGDLSMQSMEILIDAARKPFSVPKQQRKHKKPDQANEHQDQEHHSGESHSNNDDSYKADSDSSDHSNSDHNSDHSSDDHSNSGHNSDEHSSNSHESNEYRPENEHSGNHEFSEHNSDHHSYSGSSSDNSESYNKRSEASYDSIHIPDDMEQIIHNPQDLWFVNTRPCIRDSSYGLFSRFNNKWLAVLLNSFDEMLIMDTDSVPFISTSELFDLEEYQKHKAYLFRDRAINFLRMQPSEAEYMVSLMPSREESELFHMEPITNFSTMNPMVHPSKLYTHFIESGLVMVSRKKHLAELLMSTSLQLFVPASAPTYGDKEMFWLGFSVAGSEQYVVNELPAGSIGRRKQYSSLRDDGTPYDYNMTSSTQPAHLNKNRKLLWVNSGLRNCKLNNDYTTDWFEYHELREEFQDIEDYHQFLLAPLDVEGVLLLDYIPPATYDKLRDLPVGFKQCHSKGCSGYTWCAYDHPDFPGEWVEFTNEDREVINKVSQYWNADPMYFDPDDNTH